MASTLSANVDLNPSTNHTNHTRLLSSSREPRVVRSILLSASGPPGLHAREGRGPGEPSVSEDVLAPALGPNPNAPSVQPEATTKSPSAAAAAAPVADADVRHPSIHISPDLSESQSEPTANDARAMPPPPPPVRVSVSAPAAPRARRTPLELPGSALDQLYTTERKRALEGTSPKPCIVPGNALHLIDDDPSAPRSATPPSVIVVGHESEHGAEPETDADFDAEAEAEEEYDDGGADGDCEGDGAHRRRSASQPPSGDAGAGNGNGNGGVHPGPRVRFRSRVRITSGLHRHRHGVSATGGSTPGSTTSGSPSSSISAPLRYQADENAAWGPIGKRLSAYASAGGWQRRPQAQVQVVQTRVGPNGEANFDGARNGATRGRGGVRGARGYGERTPLLRPPASEDEDEDAEGMSEGERTMRASALRKEEEAVFGKWPWRIFNRHWWWWHVEPVFCCCADDPDYEDF